MRTHSFQGAELFDPSVSELDALSHEIALTHHERWDGKGYPRQLKGNDIPLAGRICAIADVYDALISRRVYKEKWDEQDVIRHISEESGKHFDPELVESFNSVYEVISAIHNKYKE
jgi:putative two-component system response regulator